LLKNVKTSIGELKYLMTPQLIKQELDDEMAKLQEHIVQVSNATNELDAKRQQIKEATAREAEMFSAYQQKLMNLHQLQTRFEQEREKRMSAEMCVKWEMYLAEMRAKEHVASVQAQSAQAAQAAQTAQAAQAHPPAVDVQVLEQAVLKPKPAHPFSQALSGLTPAQQYIKGILTSEKRKLESQGKSFADHPLNLPTIKELTSAQTHLFPPSKSRGLFKALVHHIPGVMHKKLANGNFMYYL
jgi:hypothetical protein